MRGSSEVTQVKEITLMTPVRETRTCEAVKTGHKTQGNQNIAAGKTEIMTEPLSLDKTQSKTQVIGQWLFAK